MAQNSLLVSYEKGKRKRMRKRKRKKRDRRTIFDSFLSFFPIKKDLSPAGNRTPVFRVTGGDTYHYTTEDSCPHHVQNGLKLRNSWKDVGKKDVPVRGIEPRPRRWERRILTTRPRGSGVHYAGKHRDISSSWLPSSRCQKLFSPGIEPGTLCVWSTRDNHYTKETLMLYKIL